MILLKPSFLPPTPRVVLKVRLISACTAGRSNNTSIHIYLITPRPLAWPEISTCLPPSLFSLWLFHKLILWPEHVLCDPQVSQDVSLPEFFVVGYRQRRVLFPLSSGNYSRNQLFASKIACCAIYLGKNVIWQTKIYDIFQIFLTQKNMA